MSAIITLSVISRTRADGSSPVLSSAARTSGTIESDCSCFTERLTLIVNGPLPGGMVEFRRAACRQASPSTQRPIGMINPVSSASGMN